MKPRLIQLSQWLLAVILTSDAICPQICGSTLVQIMACCLTAPSHYLNQCWRRISQVLWHSLKSNFTASAQTTIMCNEQLVDIFKITITSPRGQCVNVQHISVIGTLNSIVSGNPHLYFTGICRACCDIWYPFYWRPLANTALRWWHGYVITSTQTVGCAY